MSTFLPISEYSRAVWYISRITSLRYFQESAHRHFRRSFPDRDRMRRYRRRYPCVPSALPRWVLPELITPLRKRIRHSCVLCFSFARWYGKQRKKKSPVTCAAGLFLQKTGDRDAAPSGLRLRRAPCTRRCGYRCAAHRRFRRRAEPAQPGRFRRWRVWWCRKWYRP